MSSVHAALKPKVTRPSEEWWVAVEAAEEGTKRGLDEGEEEVTRKRRKEERKKDRLPLTDLSVNVGLLGIPKKLAEGKKVPRGTSVEEESVDEEEEPADEEPAGDEALEKTTLKQRKPRQRYPKRTSAKVESVAMTKEEYLEAFYSQVPIQLRGMVQNFLAEDCGTTVLLTDLVEPNEIMARFHQFAAAEAQQFGGDIATLVFPSGSLQDRLGVLLHYPTFSTTSDTRHGGTLDLGSPCPRKLADKGVPQDGCLWLDTYARRQDAPPRRGEIPAGMSEVPMDDWPQEQRSVHEAFSTWVMDSSQAKVWVICGARNRKRLEKQKQGLTRFIVTTGDIRLQLFVQCKVDGSIRCLFVCVPHPESLFYPNNQPVGRWSDHGWNLAGALIGIPLDQTYFQRLTSNEEHQNFGVLPTLMRDRALELNGNPPLQFEDLAPCIIGYLRKQRIIGKEAITKMHTESRHSTLTLTILKQMTDRGAETKWFRQPWAVLLRRGDESTLLFTRCIDCKKGVKVDPWPTYEITTGDYVAHIWACDSCPRQPSGTKRKRLYAPVDPPIPFIPYTELSKKWELMKPKAERKVRNRPYLNKTAKKQVK